MSKARVEVRIPFVYDADAASAQARTDCGTEEITKQSFKDECDIREIVRRFGLTGELPQTLNFPVSGDFTGVTDFKSAMDVVTAANQEFMKLPGELRKRFGHDPGELLAFLGDDRNREEAKKLGLLREPERDRMGELITAVGELKPKQDEKK